MRIMKRKDPHAPKQSLCTGRWQLNEPLLRLSPAPQDNWTIGDSLEHTLVFGGTGSGKTSATGAVLAKTFLIAGYGGLVLCAKPDEASRWDGYARVCGRATATIRFDHTARYRFNFLDYLMSLPPEHGGGQADNAVNALLRVLEAAHSRDGLGGSEAQNDFWNKAIRDLLSNAIGSLYHAHKRVRLRRPYQARQFRAEDGGAGPRSRLPIMVLLLRDYAEALP
jgi:hypothetical protein